jgi:C-terminal processing protease CtpA/Prc
MAGQQAPIATVTTDSVGLVTATIHKEYGSTGGITLRTLGSKLIVSYVEPGSSHLDGMKRGLEVVTMNNVDCSVLSETSAQQLLNADEMVTFLCRELESTRKPGTVVTSVIHKGSMDTSVGIGMKVVNGQVFISSIKPGSLAAASDLQAGMIIQHVNNFEFDGLNSKQASHMIAMVPDKLEIVAKFPGVAGKEETNPNLKSCSVLIPEDKPEGEGETTSRAGIELMTANNHTTGLPMVVVKSIDPKGPLFGGELRVGMQIVKIQNIDCTSPTCTAEQVTALLNDSAQPGAMLLVLAQDCSAVRRPPGSFLVVVVNKESVDTKLGIVLASSANKLFIKKITNGTLGATTELEPGMIVHSINNISVTHKTSAEVAEILGPAQGTMSFLVQTDGNTLVDPSRFVTAVMTKTWQEDKVGIALRPQQDGHLVITKISEEGCAKDTDLKVGMRVLKINNVDLEGKSTVDAVSLLTESTGILTVIAQKPDLAPGTYMVASMSIPVVPEGEKRPSLGIKLKQIAGQFVISGLDEGGLAAKTDLQVGMLLRSLNNVDCASLKTLNEVLAVFVNAVGTLNILAVTPKGNPLLTSQLVTASVEIAADTEIPTGALAYDAETGKIKVTDAAASGLLFGTALRAGMEILAINNVDASILSKAGVEAILKTPGKLLFLAKRQELPKDFLLTEIISKTTSDTPMGIGIRRKDGRIYISSIKDGTLASTSRLQPGMELISVDNEDCRGTDPMIIAKILREAPAGSITIVASTKAGPISKHGSDNNLSLVTAILEKGDKENKVGLAFLRKRGQLVITKINSNTPAAETDLLVGMEVLSINNTDVGEISSTEASKLLANSEGAITILAKRPSLPAGSFVTAAIMKENPTTPIGIKLGGTKSGQVVIRSVTELSPASFTELEEGMIVKSINNVQTNGLSTKEVAVLLAECTTSITILAQTTQEVAMGRASFKSMRSLSGNRSYSDDTTIESTMSGDYTKRNSMMGSDQSVPFNLADIEETPEEDVYKPPSLKSPGKAIKILAPAETITIVTGGRRESFVVQNVVEC